MMHRARYWLRSPRVAAEAQCVGVGVLLVGLASVALIAGCTAPTGTDVGLPATTESQDASATGGAGPEPSSEHQQAAGAGGIAGASSAGTGGIAGTSSSGAGGNPQEAPLGGGAGNPTTGVQDAGQQHELLSDASADPAGSNAVDGGVDGSTPAPRDAGERQPLHHVFALAVGGGAFSLPEECTKDWSCPGSHRCFALSEDFGVCDRQSQAASTGCTGDEACESDRVCISVEQECSCAPELVSMCVDSLCETDLDCGDGTVCTPTSLLVYGTRRCLAPRCERDADCLDGPQGRCSLLLQPPLQAGEPRVADIRCVYEGGDEPDTDSCQGTPSSPLLGPEPGSPYYCPELDR